jgi:5-methyltetrahydrofolate--homocysteine methyltransferase
MPYAINGIRQLKEAMEVKAIPPKRMMAYPNAGMARLDKNHRTYYEQAPEEMTSYLPDVLEAGAYFIGGCCGTGPSHIKAFREAISRVNV